MLENIEHITGRHGPENICENSLPLSPEISETMRAMFSPTNAESRRKEPQMTTVVIAREFRGARLFLVTSRPLEFTWSNNRKLAMTVSVDVARRLITEAQAYAADAFAIDELGTIIVPAASNAAQPVITLANYVENFVAYSDVIQSKNGTAERPWLDFATVKERADAREAVLLVRHGQWDGKPLAFRVVRDRNTVILGA